ncbi:MAG: hypothetical protein HKN26_02585 [Acidimicrobiales bacterium]|nr:hypothetical protein [Acidimicrobiales bacterium]
MTAKATAARNARLAALVATALTASSCTTFTWGNNDVGQLGDGTTTDRATPAAITMPGGTGALWTDIDAGTHHTCEVRHNDQTLWCWGSNENAQLGDGTTTDRSVPTQAQGSGWHSVAAGHDYSCAIKTDQTLWCWGANDYGQLGDGTTANRTAPTQVGAATAWQTVAANFNQFDVAFPQVPDLGGAHTCAIKTDQTLWCWGANDFGQLGTGTPDPGQLQPTQIGTHQWTDIALGNLQTCAVRADGTMWCTGAGIEDGLDVSNLTQIGSDTDWNELALGATWGLFEGDGFAVWAVAHHGCAIKTDDSLWCWGWNARGQVGVPIVNHLDHLIPPSGAFEFDPVQVGSANDWVGVAAGAIRTCGIRAVGPGNEAWCWGDDDDQPAQVDLGGKSAAEVALGRGFRAVLTF